MQQNATMLNTETLSIISCNVKYINYVCEIIVIKDE